MKTPARKGNLIKEPSVIHDYVTWFEIPALDFERAVKFYEGLYEFEMETTSINGYQMAFFPSESGIGGAIIAGEGSAPSDKGPLVYLNAGKRLEAMISKIEDAGGRILLDKTKINDTAGDFALFIDTEGNKLALHSKG